MTSDFSRKRTHKESYWLGHLAAWRESGLTIAAYVRETGVGYSRFAYWRRRLENARLCTTDRDAPLIVPVPMPSAPSHSAQTTPFKIYFRDSCCLEIPAEFSTNALQALLACLDNRALS